MGAAALFWRFWGLFCRPRGGGAGPLIREGPAAAAPGRAPAPKPPEFGPKPLDSEPKALRAARFYTKSS